MKIYLGADHRGYKLKEKIKEWLKEWGEEHEDMGNKNLEPTDDFPDYAKRVGEKVASEESLGVLLCGSGGMALVANKFKGVRAVEAWSVETAKHAKAHDGSNVLVLPADFVDEETAKKMIRVWLDTSIETGVKYVRRLNKIKKIEERNFVC